MKIGKYSVDISNPDKEIFPKAGITKEDLVNYYLRIYDLMIPHLRGRPLTMQRFPDGIEKDGFFQKERSGYFPDWINSEKLERKGGKPIEMVIVNKKATIAYLANQAGIVYHPWLSRASQSEYPDKMIFDLDPSGGDFSEVKKCAKRLIEFLENEFDFPVFIMSTGSKGLHVTVPLKKNLKFEKVKEFAKKTAQIMVDRFPDDYTVEVRKEKRGDKIFLDYLRNEYAQTSVAPYSLRATSNASIAAPLTPGELDRFEGPHTIHAGNIFKRLSQKKDPWDNFFDRAISLKSPLKKITDMSA